MSPRKGRIQGRWALGRRYGPSLASRISACEMPPHYRDIAEHTTSGVPFSGHEIGDRIGLSRMGWRHALRRLEALGIIRVDTKLGRHGWTRIYWLCPVSWDIET